MPQISKVASLQKGQRFQTPLEVARFLSFKRSEILERWDRAARQELEPARHESKPALYDQLPQFLQTLEKGLVAESRSRKNSYLVERHRRENAVTHGDERAKTPTFTLEQVLFEYHLLRDVILKVFEECQMRVSPSDLGYIHSSVDEAMGIAAQRFSDIKSGQEKMGLERLESEKVIRERFVSTLSHDLRTPLSAIRMSAQLLFKMPNQTEEMRALTIRILKDVDRTDQMITDLLDANLIQAGEKLLIDIQAVDLWGIAKDTVGEFTRMYGNQFILSGDEQLTGFWCRKGIRRSIENLLGNAVKYGDPHQPIHIRIWKSGDQVFVAVHNFGNPIAVEEQTSLFLQFRRSITAQGSGKKGWGLGLTLVRGVTEAHGGSVKVESSPETGTTFTMVLPIDSRVLTGIIPRKRA